MGREVMAVPGSPLDPRAQGCNGLIRDGATLIQNAGDVLEMVRPTAVSRVASPVEPYQSSPAEPGEHERRVVEELLGPSPVPVDELVRLSGLASGAVQLVLLELDPGGLTGTQAARSAWRPLDGSPPRSSPSRVCVRKDTSEAGCG